MYRPLAQLILSVFLLAQIRAVHFDHFPKEGQSNRLNRLGAGPFYDTTSVKNNLNLLHTSLDNGFSLQMFFCFKVNSLQAQVKSDSVKIAFEINDQGQPIITQVHKHLIGVESHHHKEICNGFLYSNPGIPAWKKSPSLWNAETPKTYSYHIHFTYDRSSAEDYVHKSIGFRAFSVKKNRPYLNGRALTIKAVEWPNVLDSSASERALGLLKRHFINTILISKRQPDIFYEQCSRLGFYLFCQFDNITDVEALQSSINPCLLGFVKTNRKPNEVTYYKLEELKTGSYSINPYGTILGIADLKRLDVAAGRLFPLQIDTTSRGDSVYVNITNKFDFSTLKKTVVSVFDSATGSPLRQLTVADLKPMRSLTTGLCHKKDVKNYTLFFVITPGEEDRQTLLFYRKITAVPSRSGFRMHYEN
ncbi:hypothetical protein [Tellurirhabdus rosea]|uniref:hypothetical protein n=1 Tax=Tellurirhabdus rosea TaxID=2674997 RepID=UPI00224F22C2|nr:hypothetical protein [Tellurirhabdus rosea]